MNHRFNSRNLPLCIERLVEEGYTINIEHSNKLVRITCEGSSLKNLMPFRQTRSNGAFSISQSIEGRG